MGGSFSVAPTNRKLPRLVGHVLLLIIIISVLQLRGHSRMFADEEQEEHHFISAPDQMPSLVVRTADARCSEELPLMDDPPAP